MLPASLLLSLKPKVIQHVRQSGDGLREKRCHEPAKNTIYSDVSGVIYTEVTVGPNHHSLLVRKMPPFDWKPANRDRNIHVSILRGAVCA
jgi:hypothetical protein